MLRVGLSFLFTNQFNGKKRKRVDLMKEYEESKKECVACKD
jgi:hypothetical protein